MHEEVHKVVGCYLPVDISPLLFPTILLLFSTVPLGRQVLQIREQRVDLFLREWATNIPTEARHCICFLAAVNENVLHVVVEDSVVVRTDQGRTAGSFGFGAMTHGAVCYIEVKAEGSNAPCHVAARAIFVSQYFRLCIFAQPLMLVAHKHFEGYLDNWPFRIIGGYIHSFGNAVLLH